MNLREAAGFRGSYAGIDREERNCAAILYAALSQGENARRFVEYCGVDAPSGVDIKFFFEYAFLRDLWRWAKDNEKRKAMIRERLLVKSCERVLSLPLAQLNAYFGVPGSPSSKLVQMPGRWTVARLHEVFEDDEEFLAACKFKWAFNIKPDIVFELGEDRAICIEIKYESGEGSYPSSSAEKALFARRGLGAVDQTGMQRYLLEDLLGMKTEFRLLSLREAGSGSHEAMSWKDAFGALDLGGLLPFQRDMARLIASGPGRGRGRG